MCIDESANPVDKTLDESKRTKSFGQNEDIGFVDRLGRWLSSRKFRKCLKRSRSQVLLDVGCGFDGGLSAPLAKELDWLILTDIAISEDVKNIKNVESVEGHLPDTLFNIQSGSVDFVLCNSVIEHLADPLSTLRELRRIIGGQGTAFINAPTWMGKRALEFSAFRLGLSPASEIDDHKRYFSTQQLWSVLIEAGFKPHELKIRRHKFGLNCFAVCSVNEQTN
jgi:2-polyprenyl-3-methyl-5-hydroxy-6-metoxy-1,4-benzoquinol methylase